MSGRKVMMFRTGIMGTVVLLLLPMLAAEQKKPNPPVNRDAAIASDFEKRVAEYMKLHQQAESGLGVSKPTESAAVITELKNQLAARIRRLRPQARRGDIFTPEIAGLFQRLTAVAARGSDGSRIRTSLERAEPIRGVRLDVNQSYPDGLPLQSTPPSLLLNFPKLPKELEYRFVGRELVLRDIPANLIVDVIPELVSLRKQ